jgi:hypothetical protein
MKSPRVVAELVRPRTAGARCRACRTAFESVESASGTPTPAMTNSRRVMEVLISCDVRVAKRLTPL